MASLKNTTINDAGYIQLPVGTTAQRPASPVNGDMRFNSEFKVPETYVDGAWKYMPPIVENGLVLHLDAAEPASYPGTGTTWYDLSGNNRNANIYGSPTFTNNYFDITSDSTYIAVSNNGLVPRTNDFTYSCWINFDALNTYSSIFENGSWTDTLLFRHQFGNTLAVYAEGAGIVSLSWIPTTGTWYNVILKRENNVGSCYANGNIIGSSFTFTTDINLANTNLLLMRSQHANNQFTNGKISTFSIYNRSLSQSEITQNFNALRGRYGI